MVFQRIHATAEICDVVARSIDGDLFDAIPSETIVRLAFGIIVYPINEMK